MNVNAIRKTKTLALLHFVSLLLLMTHHEETWFNAKRCSNPNPEGGTKVQ